MWVKKTKKMWVIFKIYDFILSALPWQNETSWVLVNVAALYWRVKGVASQAINCLRVALHTAPPQSKVGSWSMLSLYISSVKLLQASHLFTDVFSGILKSCFTPVNDVWEVVYRSHSVVSWPMVDWSAICLSTDNDSIVWSELLPKFLCHWHEIWHVSSTWTSCRCARHYVPTDPFITYLFPWTLCKCSGGGIIIHILWQSSSLYCCKVCQWHL